MESELLAHQVVDAIRIVVGPGPTALHEPGFNGNEWAYLRDCLDSTFVSSVGAYVDRFESELAAYTGAKYAIAVVNGTAALHVAARLAGVQQNDEVLIPALTFVATANAVTYCGAIPHFVDSEERTLGLDPYALRDYLRTASESKSGHCVNRETGRRIRAVVPMHTFGHPVDIEGLLRLCHDCKIELVEDAAESLGSFYQGRHTGTFGKLGILSFNGNKTITTGGGGVILTNDESLARRAKHLTTTAKVPHRWEFRHDEIGYNYRMPNINAALGCAQLEQLPDKVKAKRQLFRKYYEVFSRVEGIRMVNEPEGCESNYWLQAIKLDEAQKSERDPILTLTNEAGLMTRPVWTLLDRIRPFSSCPRMPLPVASSLEQRLINIPSSPQLVAQRDA